MLYNPDVFKGRTKPWEQSLIDYVGAVPISVGTSASNSARDELSKRQALLDSGEASFTTLQEFPYRGVRFGTLKSTKPHLVVTTCLVNEDNRIVAADMGTMPFAPEEFRGQKYGVLLNICIEAAGRRKPASSYTIEGLRTRISTHMRHIENALSAGLTVPDELWQDYNRRGNSVTLKEPMTPERYEHIVTEYRREMLRRMEAERTQGYTAIFRTTPYRRSRDFIHYGPEARGDLFALAMHETFGLPIMVTKLIPNHLLDSPECGDKMLEFCAYQCLDGEEVVDCDGKRPIDTYLDDLQRRGQIKFSDHPDCTLVTDVYENAADLNISYNQDEMFNLKESPAWQQAADHYIQIESEKSLFVMS